jgi:hypothetical protein
MGQPVKVLDLAKRMVSLSGLSVKSQSNPNGDIEIQTTGLRPGEKLYEELLIGDQPLPTIHPCIMKAHEPFWPWEELQQRLQALEAALDRNDTHTVRRLLEELVPGYQPKDEIVDWIWLENGKLNTPQQIEVRTGAFSAAQQPGPKRRPLTGGAVQEGAAEATTMPYPHSATAH